MYALAPVSDRLSKLIPMLASDKDGEVVAAARAIGRTLNGAGLDFHVLAAAVTAPPLPIYPTFRPAARSTPKPKAPPAAPAADRLRHLAQAQFCEGMSHRLREKEVGFIASILSRLTAGREVSQKQADWLADIYRRLQLKAG